ncbi:MAG: hypothetical protein AAF243_08175 [Cyanobacteria bacterium P01_A01_bin.137]
MSASSAQIAPKELVRRLMRIARRSELESYAYPPHRARRAFELVAQAVGGHEAVACVGAVLKLIAVLRSKYASPTAADVLVEALRALPAARLIIARHWSTDRKVAFGADLLPIRPGRAPHVDAGRPARALKAYTLLVGNHDLKSAHLRARNSRRKP